MQIKDKPTFQKLAKYADYASERTGVISIKEKYRFMFPEGVAYDQVDTNPILNYSNKDFIALNSDDTIRYYLGAFKNFQDHFPIKNINLIYNLVSQDIFDYSDTFKSIFSKLNRNSTFGDLECAKYRYRVNGKLQSFDNVEHLSLDKIFSNIEQQSLLLTSKEVNVVSVVNDKDKNNRERWSVLTQYNDDGVKDLHFTLYSSSELLEKILIEGNRINVLMDRGNFHNIAPNGMKVCLENKVSPSKNIKKELNKLPVMLFRMAYAEYQLRNYINKEI